MGDKIGKVDLVKEAREQAERISREQAGAEEEELVGRRVTHDISYVAPGTRERLRGSFTTVIPEDDYITRTAQIAADKARVPWETLPPGDQARFYRLAALMVCVETKDDWIVFWCHQDGRLLVEITGWVEAHQRRFLGGDLPSGSGGTAAPVAQIDARVSPAA